MRPAPAGPAEPAETGQPELIDHHCHGVLSRDLDLPGIEALLTEATAPPPKPRRPTRPSRAARERRLADKQRRSEIKRLRRPGDE